MTFGRFVRLNRKPKRQARKRRTQRQTHKPPSEANLMFLTTKDAVKVDVFACNASGICWTYRKIMTI